MRLWTLHARYLDGRGIVALWREALLAQAVLVRGTRGYQRHPQLQRFREHPEPAAAIASYLRGVADEAERRAYQFDRTKIAPEPEPVAKLIATTGQLGYEWEHLMTKLRRRAPAVASLNEAVGAPSAHPLFEVVDGPIAAWERLPANA